ncbi:SDR family oxidoreductase [Candidatus Deferrimicrobium sp.]|uniref:SDR family oxidoreductase n=1 Tax=Candidatus Deferrimicrobium sp. TaxID=3060586 RepID=UPI002ED464D2
MLGNVCPSNGFFIEAERVDDEIWTAGGEAMAIRGDVSKEAEVQAMFRKMFDAYGTIHILVNNTGLQRDARFVDMTLHDWEFVLSVNLTGPEAFSQLLTLIPYGRIGDPEDIGRAAVWLASDASDYVNGTSVYIDGGMTVTVAFSLRGY